VGRLELGTSLTDWPMTGTARMEYPLAMLPPNKDLDPWVETMEHLSLRARRHVLYRFTPPMPLFLYRYFSSNQQYSLQNLRAVIVGSVFRLNSPSDFNDPFEIAAHFVMTATEDEKLTRYESLARQQAPHLGWRAIQARIQELMAGTAEFFTPTWQQSLRNMRDSMGVYCFAGSAKNRLMWGHYASNHKGVCLQFERVSDIRILSHAFRVSYVSDLPVLNWIVGFHEGIGKMLFSKDPCWEYEQESRILINDQAGRYLGFAPQALRRLIFGCRVDSSFVEAVESLLSERTVAGFPPVEVYAAKRHPTQYRLVVTRR
jgi:hypothetical protein